MYLELAQRIDSVLMTFCKLFMIILGQIRTLLKELEESFVVRVVFGANKDFNLSNSELASERAEALLDMIEKNERDAQELKQNQLTSGTTHHSHE